ncbi:olfactory receptor 7D11-like [Chaetodon trifascialis]|uniref:olfactory receptor 7D11-like n=1 Tax=Chaetodon trifascialis TaxID=109706 RepID=UPI0039932791
MVVGGAILIAYVLAIFANIVNILFIIYDKRLHKPMYLLICNLALVDILYTSSASPTMIGVLLAGVKTVSYVPCIIQMFVFNVGAVMEMLGVVLTLEERHGLVIAAILGPSLVNPFVYCLRTKEIKYKLFNRFKRVGASR